MQNFLFIAAGLGLLVLGGNWLLKSAVALSLRLLIPRIVIGLTVVSFATSAPELIVSLKAAVDGFPDLALGNVVGSNIANLGLVLGLVIILGSMEVKMGFFTTDWPAMMLSSILLFAFIYFDGELLRYEGGIMLLGLIMFIIYLLKFQKTPIVNEPVTTEQPMKLYMAILYLGLGGVALYFGSELLISGAVGMATYYGVSERIIAITVVSVGTSIPELAASVIAVMKKENAISIGNLIGSNIFNILGVLGLTALIKPIIVADQGLLTNDIFWMLGIAFLMLPLVFMPKKMHLGRLKGIILVAVYTLFVYLTVA